MHFEIPTEQLRNSVSHASRFTEKRPNLPVLAGILLTASENKLVLCATNLECGVEVEVSAKVLEAGKVVVPAATLAGFLANARGKTVVVKLVGELVKLDAERASASIKTYPSDDFPTLPRVVAETNFALKSVDLARAIKSVVFCASASAVKPELQSVLLIGQSGKLSAAATDSFRLAEKTVPLRSAGDVSQLLVPARNASELVRILEVTEASEDGITVNYDEHQISVQVGGVYFTSRLIDGSFPNYRQIIPSAFSTELVILKEDFSQALKSQQIFADKFSQVSFVVDSAQNSLVLTSRNPDVGEQTSMIRATITGEGATMSFNARYLADSMQAISGDSVRIKSNGAGKAIVISDAADSSYLYLAMPMNR